MVTLPTPGECRPRRKMHSAVSGMDMLPMQSAAAGPQGGSRFSCRHRAEKHCQQSRTPLRRRRGGCGRRRAGAWAPGWRRRAPTPRSGTPLLWQSRSSGRWSAPAAPGDTAFNTFKWTAVTESGHQSQMWTAGSHRRQLHAKQPGPPLGLQATNALVSAMR